MYSADSEQQMEETRIRLVERLMRLVPEPGKHRVAISGLMLTRWDITGQLDTCFYTPSIGVILQGRKESLIGAETIRYGAFDCLVNGVDMPSRSTILYATRETPLLAISLDIDRALATELVADLATDIAEAEDDADPASASLTATPEAQIAPPTLGVSLARVTPDVLDAFARLAGLLDTPEHIPFMGPLLIREIVSRVLMGPQGGALRLIHTAHSHSCQVAEAITWLRSNYSTSLHIEALADRVNMATSTFHRQFKRVTSLSPLQFQKCLRLYEARRLMLAEDMDANNAGRSVGYESTQQFNREYKRLFGEPPHRDVRRLKAI